MKIILYGAGKAGKICLDLIEKNGYGESVIGFCDKKRMNSVGDIPVYNYIDIKGKYSDVTVCVTIFNPDQARCVIEMLEKDGVKYCRIDELADLMKIDKVEFNRDFCAKMHELDDKYYEDAESDDNKFCGMKVFWGENTHFYRLFQYLDLTNVIELACGRGRHVQKYLDKAGHITLVDIVDKNLEICKERYHAYNHISYYCNNGYNLEKLKSGMYTSLFCYDAMVHFEMFDIWEYLKDIYRCINWGGYALLHHSNNDADYKISYTTENGHFNFLNAKIFAYMAYRIGFEVVEQAAVNDGLGCLTLLRK